MSDLTVEHNGWEIRYSENEDVWRCWAADVEHAKLSVVKQKLNAISAHDRRIDAVPVFIIDLWGTVTEATATLLTDDGRGVWTTRMRTVKRFDGHRTTKEREKRPLDSVILDTPENRALIAKATHLREVARKASAVADDANKAIPRATLETLKGLKPKEETP